MKMLEFIDVLIPYQASIADLHEQAGAVFTRPEFRGDCTRAAQLLGIRSELIEVPSINVVRCTSALLAQ